MACPTCEHTMQGVGTETPMAYWCPRCGTIQFGQGNGAHVEAPKLVIRCRKFEAMMLNEGNSLLPTGPQDWRSLGIAEAIHTPAARPREVS